MTITENEAVNDVAKLERLKVLNNGEKVSLTFSDAEFERRLAGLRSIMAEKDLDAVVLTSYHSIKYYSDFLFTYFGRSYAMVVTKEDTVTVTANIDAGMPWRRSYGDNLVYTDWRRDNFIHGIQEVLRTRGINVRRLGVEDDSLPLDNRNKIQAAFESATLVDVAQAAMRQRMIKSAEEIEVIKHGARIGDLGGEAIRNAITAGITEYEVALIGTEAMVHEIARTFPNSEIRDTWVWFQSGINTDGAHNWATTRKIQEHDILSLNCFPMTSGYYTALERTLFYGEPDARSLELWNINVEVHRRGLELIKPGAVCKDIAAELNEIYISHGLLANRTFGYGHSFGVLSHYYGREAGLELREDIETVLEPGMVVSMEPMIMVPEGQPGAGGYREHDILVVGENGAENITKFPFGPEHNILGVSEIAGKVGLHKSTVSRILATLELEDLVERDPTTRRFRLGLGIIALAGPLLADLDVRRVAYPVLQDLSRRTGETAALMVWDGGEAVCVEQVPSSHQVKHTTPLGTRYNTAASSSVQVFLAQLDPFAVRSLLMKGVVDHPGLTEAALDGYLVRLREIAEQGYAVNYGETSFEEVGVAAPVLDHRGEPVAAVP